MSIQVIDAENLIETVAAAPDPLRAEIGEYYSSITNPINGQKTPPTPRSFKTGKISSATIDVANTNSQVLIPIKKFTITLEGQESVFRDQTQWGEFIRSTITTDRQYLDHNFSFEAPEVTNEFVKMPILQNSNAISNEKNSIYRRYEDSTKVYPTNQLLNYNLISYPHESQKIKDIGFIRTRFDTIEPHQTSVEVLLGEFQNRIANYTGSVGELEQKQRNIFLLNKTSNTNRMTEFPFYFSSHKSQEFNPIDGFNKILEDNKKVKNLLQSLKNDLAFSNRSFSIGGQIVAGKIFNAIDIMTSTSISAFSESTDELFLLPENEINHSDPSERFVNQVESIKFLSDMRKYISNNSRTLKMIYKNINSKNFLLGYKIEKYIDNDATQPIQTYYTLDSNFIDTQIKYGRRYVYKTKAFVGILGSSYSYSNLTYSNPDGLDTAPTDKKYWASMDVQVQPSFQILEYEIDVHETAFIDNPTSPPYIMPYGNAGKSCVSFLMHPRSFMYGDVSTMDFPPVGDLRDSDTQIANLYEDSGDKKLSHVYFTGVYEIYRLDSPPESKESFANGYLTTVDEFALVGNLNKGFPIETMNVDQASYTDNVISNQKYYYAFRTMTYHGTPSQLTNPIEIEIQRDSDEYKISINKYEYPIRKDYSTQKSAKRLVRIVPNLERLFFSKEEDANNWELDNGSLVVNAISSNHKTFKIRATSKHTGKKIDLNITFKLNKDDTFNT